MLKPTYTSVLAQPLRSHAVGAAIAFPATSCFIDSRPTGATITPRRQLSCRRRLLTTASRPALASLALRKCQWQRRSLFITTQPTPNADALKFMPGTQVKPPQISAPFIEYLTPRSTITPPYASPLAARLMDVDGVSSVFYGDEFITITKREDASWAIMKPELFALITEAVARGEEFVKPTDAPVGGDPAAAQEDAHGEKDSLEYSEGDDEVVGMIKELLATRIRPTIQQDGGDIEFLGFKAGRVQLKLRGACRTCDSSTQTLKNGIEKMLSFYIEEVEGVDQVLGPEEEIAVKEFAKFEENLKKQQAANANKVGKAVDASTSSTS